MTVPPDAVDYVFDPHVVWALIALCVAIFILVLLSAVPIEDRDRKQRR